MALRNTFIFLLSALLFTQTSAASDKDDFVGTGLLVHTQVLNESGNWEIPENSVGMIGSVIPPLLTDLLSRGLSC